VKIPLGQVREGCAQLIDRIRSHAADPRVLYETGRYSGAFLLILFGYEDWANCSMQTAVTHYADLRTARGRKAVQEAWETPVVKVKDRRG